MKVTTLTTDKTVSLELEPEDGLDKNIIELFRGCTQAKLDVNGVIKITVDRPKRPLKYEHASDEKAGDA